MSFMRNLRKFCFHQDRIMYGEWKKFLDAVYVYFPELFQGPYSNYVDKILKIFDPPPPAQTSLLHKIMQQHRHLAKPPSPHACLRSMAPYLKKEQPKTTENKTAKIQIDQMYLYGFRAPNQTELYLSYHKNNIQKSL